MEGGSKIEYKAETEKQEGGKRKERCEYLVKKRLKNCEYIQKVFGEGVFWMNVVRMSGDAVLAIQDQMYIRLKAEQLYTMSLSLAKLVDIDNLVNLIKALYHLFDEFNRYYNGETKLSPLILCTQSFVLQSCRKGRYTASLHKEAQKQIRHMLTTDHVVLRSTETRLRLGSDAFSEEKELSPDAKDSRLLQTQLSDGRNSLIRPQQTKPAKLPVKANVLEVLPIINVPCELNMKEVVHGLCEILKVIYPRFSELSNPDEDTMKQFIRIDKLIKQYTLHPLTQMANEAASWTLKHQLDKLFS